MSNVLLGITGGIAAYKSAVIARLLMKSGHKVRVMMTSEAEKFVGAVTLAALTGNEVMTGSYSPSAISHIDFAKWADICVVAPATANIIGKLASGIADDCVSTTLLALSAPLVIAPAMNNNMYAHSAVQRNLAQLKTWGVHIIEPADGELACADSGKGRMREADEVVAFVNAILKGTHEKGQNAPVVATKQTPIVVQKQSPDDVAIKQAADIAAKEATDIITKQATDEATRVRNVDHEKVLAMIAEFENQSIDEYLDEAYSDEDHQEGIASGSPFDGLRVLITAGPTKEYIDPVRYITNRSSGRMGYALAEEAQGMGAQVTLVTGETALTANVANVIKVQTSAEMYDAVMSNLAHADVIIMAAAVADYTPIEMSTEKIKKTADTLTLTLVKTKDILKEAGVRKTDSQILIGFAAETENIEENALKKLASKNLDIIAANDVSDSTIGFDSEMNDVTLYFKDGSQTATGKCEKKHIAKIILTEGAILYNKSLVR